MRQAWLIFRQEMFKFFRSPGTFALLAFFYLICGLFMFITLLQSSSSPQQENPFQTFWQLQWIGNVILVPLLTMRLLSSQRRSGLLSSILSTPTSPVEVVLGEFATAYGLYVLCWLSAGLYMGMIFLSPVATVDKSYLFNFSAMAGGAIFCMTSGVPLIGLGIFCSSLTRNGWLSGALTACLILLIVMLPALFGELNNFPTCLDYLGELANFSDGLISLGHVVMEILAGFFLLVAAVLVIERGAD